MGGPIEVQIYADRRPPWLGTPRCRAYRGPGGAWLPHPGRGSTRSSRVGRTCARPARETCEASMIVLDEQLQGLGLEHAVSRWYRGAVVVVTTLRPGTVVKDEAIPTLLRRCKQPTFVTINHTDFWRRIPADRSYCIVCLALTIEQAAQV